MSEKPASFEQQHTSLEILRESAQTRLHGILYTPLTVENIETFADEALDQTVDLVKELVHEYQTNPNLEGDLSLDPQQQEDAVCEKLGLPNIQDILQRILEVRDNIESIKQYLEQPKEGSGTVITPPDELEQPLTGEAGNRAFERKKLVPRLLTLMYILQTDFDLDIKNPEEVQTLEGEVTSNMMRKTPYVRVTTPDLQRSVYICDEEGNASYVFDTEKLEELHIPLDDLDIDGKQDKNSLIAMHPSVGIRMKQTPNWRDRMKSYLENELPAQAIKTETDDMTMREETPRSEFDKREKKNWLSYEEWCKEVKEAWDAIPEEKKPTNAWNWYHSERANKPKWHSLPKRKYAREGFLGMTQIVGKKNKFEKQFLSFDQWRQEVKTAWDLTLDEGKKSSVIDWYELERESGNHEDTWPGETYLKDKYAEYGYINLNIIVGKKNKFEKKYLSVAEWSAEVKNAWDMIPSGSKPTNIEDWYTKERNSKHIDTWPYLAILKDRYGDDSNLHRLVGKENILKKEYLSYGKWVEEVRSAWGKIPENERPTNRWRWYEDERKSNHIKTWPSQSDIKDKYGDDFPGIKTILDF